MEENFLTSIKNRADNLLNYQEDYGRDDQNGNRRGSQQGYRYGDL